jgi:hypothetical protein
MLSFSQGMMMTRRDGPYPPEAARYIPVRSILYPQGTEARSSYPEWHGKLLGTFSKVVTCCECQVFILTPWLARL